MQDLFAKRLRGTAEAKSKIAQQRLEAEEAAKKAQEHLEAVKDAELAIDQRQTILEELTMVQTSLHKKDILDKPEELVAAVQSSIECILALAKRFAPQPTPEGNPKPAKVDPVEVAAVKILRDEFRDKFPTMVKGKGKFDKAARTKFEAEFLTEAKLKEARKQAPERIAADRKAAYQAAKKSKEKAEKAKKARK